MVVTFFFVVVFLCRCVPRFLSPCPSDGALRKMNDRERETLLLVQWDASSFFLSFILCFFFFFFIFTFRFQLYLFFFFFLSYFCCC